MSATGIVPSEYRPIRLDRIGSTNDEAMRLASLGADPGLVIVADEQMSGRGRLGRAWSSPPGNLYMSVLLPLDRDVPELAQLSFVAALALYDATRDFLPATTPLMLKWPNDVLLAGGKLAGILLETFCRPGGSVEAVILGIGVNLRHGPADTPYPVACLSDHGPLVAPDVFLPVLLQRLSHWRACWRRDGFAGLASAWQARAHPLGYPLRAKVGNRLLEGRFAGLAEDGALMLECGEQRHRLTAADVFPLNMPQS